MVGCFHFSLRFELNESFYIVIASAKDCCELPQTEEEGSKTTSACKINIISNVLCDEKFKLTGEFGYTLI